MSMQPVRTPRPPQKKRSPQRYASAPPPQRRPPPRKRPRPVNWFAVAIIGAVTFLIGTLGMIAVIGVIYASDGNVLAFVTPPTPTPTPIPRWLPTYALSMRLYDPLADETITWAVLPDVWADWMAIDLTAAPDFPIPLDAAAVRAYLNTRQAELGTDRHIDLEEAVTAVVNAATISSPTLRVYHNDTQHIVQSGESIISIAWDYGLPYPYVQAANPGVDSLSIGQSITIPSRDALLPLPVINGKRIVVSIPEQRVRVYENGALKWDWSASTGINSSPTWAGVYQILSHEPNAYASNWDLWMPNFLGVYHPIPNADFINGFHGFPTRGGSQLLWTNSLGTRVTYGCILLSNDNIAQLYPWAEEGVVVEIQG